MFQDIQQDLFDYCRTRGRKVDPTSLQKAEVLGQWMHPYIELLCELLGDASDCIVVGGHLANQGPPPS